MSRGICAGLTLLLVGCAAVDAESPAEFPSAQTRLEPLADTQPPAPAIEDSYWIHQSVEEATRPPPHHRQSISLGFVGDEPLSGGVMRDTPMSGPDVDPNQGMTWQQYIRTPSWPSRAPMPVQNAPCTCQVR